MNLSDHIHLTKHITFGSVCSGIEAASVAWAPLGWRAAWLAEIEPYPCALLAHHYPNVPNLGDMREIPRLLRSGVIYPPDVFTGGTPCQAFSLAGLRNSLGDARGNLSLTFCQIADEIDIQRRANGLLPAVVMWENVPGVLSTKDNAFGHFLAGLAGEDDPLVPPGQKWPDAGCVYGPTRTVAWRVQDAQYFGLAQRRRRVFVVASARAGFDPVSVLFEFDGVRRDSAPSRQAPQDAAGTLTSSLGRRGGQPNCGSTPGQLLPVAYGGARTSGAIDVSPALLASDKGPKLDFESEALVLEDVAGTLTAAYAEQSGQNPGTMPGGLQLAPIAFDARQHPVSNDEVFGALSSSSPQAQAVAFQTRGSNINVGDVAGTIGTKCDCASGSAPMVCVTGDITHTLKAEGFDASEDGTGRGQPIINVAEPRMAVRRLTPRECERLQGFPDDYTLVPHRGKPAADGPRYKALGNSWAVKNVRWLGRRIDAQLRALNAAAA